MVDQALVVEAARRFVEADDRDPRIYCLGTEVFAAYAELRRRLGLPHVFHEWRRYDLPSGWYWE